MQVLASDRGIFMELNYSPHEINGQSIMALTGPRSDPRMLQSAIKAMQGHKIQLILYDAARRERHMIVSCSPFHNAGIYVGCLINLHSSEAITLQDAFKAFRQASALVSADAPHAVHMANDAFLARFECSRPDVLGRPLDIFHSASGGVSEPDCLDPALSAQLCADSEAAWSAMLRAALGGRAARLPADALNCRGGAGEEVACLPVVEAPNGRIRHLLVTFLPSPCCGTGTDDSDADPADPRAAAAVQRVRRPEFSATASNAPGVLTCPRRHSPGPAIVPRRKPHSGGATLPAPPVVVTRELVTALADLPLTQAAAAAGICATSFKRACRKLGVRRWVYRRHRSIDSDTERATAAAARTAARGGVGPGADVQDSGGRAVVGGGGGGDDDDAHGPGTRSTTTSPGGSLDRARGAAYLDSDGPWAGLSDSDAAAAITLVGMAAAAASRRASGGCGAGPAGGGLDG